MVKLQIILGSTRPGRAGEAVADWVLEQAIKRDDIEVELVDVADYELPLLDEPIPPSIGKYTKAHTKKWAEKIDEADGFIFVAAEYNHSIDGSNGGSRAVEHLRGVAAEIQIADVREQVLLNLANDFKDYSIFQPTKQHEQKLNKVLDQVVAWAEAMQYVRNTNAVEAF
jgi:NAD(P)H-dependent FMN reductase